MLKVPAGTRAGQQLRLAGRGIARANAAPGNLYAMVQLVVPTQASERERELWKELAATTTFAARANFGHGEST
jgi:curved DNA-binding protein